MLDTFIWLKLSFRNEIFEFQTEMVSFSAVKFE